MTTAPGRPREPAMTDVARVAGVSHQTVSRVLNDHPNVRESTRVRVLAAIAELGYRPNRAAKALVTGRSQTIGLIAQASTLYGPASMQAAFGEAAAAAGYAVSVASVRTLDAASITGALERLLDQRVAGLALLAPVADADAAVGLVPTDVPLVMIDGDPARAGALVTVDQEEGGRLATEHLLAAGHATVWHVSGPPEWFDSQGRARGWRAALEDAGAAVPQVIPAGWSARSGYEVGQEVARRPEVTAVFTANDHLALGLVRALAEHGRRVPDDVSVVGFDDVPESGFFLPPLTTVRQDFGAVARTSLEVLLGRIDGDDGDGHHLIAPVLVERDSVAPPRA